MVAHASCFQFKRVALPISPLHLHPPSPHSFPSSCIQSMHLNLVDDTRWMSTNDCSRALKASCDQQLYLLPLLMLFPVSFLTCKSRHGAWNKRIRIQTLTLSKWNHNFGLFLEHQISSDSALTPLLFPMDGSYGGNMVLLNLSALWWMEIEQRHLYQEKKTPHASFR